MTALKNLSPQKKYVIGIFSAGMTYIAVRCLFAIDNDIYGFTSHSATAVSTAFCIIYSLILCAVLSVAVNLCPKKNMDIPASVPFVFICGLGLCRFYISGTEYSPVAIVFFITLVCNLFSVATGFHFVGALAILSAIFLSPSLSPAVAVAVCVAAVTEINSENIKKKNASYLCIALDFLMLLVYGAYRFTHTADTVKLKFTDREIIIIVIFAIIYLAPFVFACVKKSGSTEKAVGVCLFLSYALSVFFVPMFGEMSSTMAVICAASLPTVSFMCIKKENCPQLYSFEKKLAENKPLYLLVLAFFTRAVGFVAVNFEEVIS